MRFTRLILALTSFLILITQTDLFASTVLHKTSMVDLSNNAIICMHQDPDGYLWIGTYDGLNLYNGKDTYVYRFELNNKNSLCSNIIHKISDAEPGFLWISTSLGINKFSLKERKVTESFPGYMECDLLASDSSGITLAICKENRISCYTPSSDGFRDLPREGVGPQTVRTLFAGTDGHFYLLLASGILKKLTPDFSDTTFNLLSEERQFHNKPILSAFYENNHIFIVDTDNKFIIRKTKCFDFWERNVLFPKTKRSFFRTPKHPLPCPFPLNFSLLIITKKFGNLAKNRYICIV